LYAARLTLEQHGSSGDLARDLGIKPYPAEKLMSSARRFSLTWCRKAVIACAQTDLAMKSGGGNGEELLTNLLLELAAPIKKGYSGRVVVCFVFGRPLWLKVDTIRIHWLSWWIR